MGCYRSNTKSGKLITYFLWINIFIDTQIFFLCFSYDGNRSMCRPDRPQKWILSMVCTRYVELVIFVLAKASRYICIFAMLPWKIRLCIMPMEISLLVRIYISLFLAYKWIIEIKFIRLLRGVLSIFFLQTLCIFLELSCFFYNFL